MRMSLVQSVGRAFRAEPALLTRDCQTLDPGAFGLDTRSRWSDAEP